MFMKRIFAFMLAACMALICTAAVAENIDVSAVTAALSKANSGEEFDLSALTEDELWDVIAAARMELGKYNPAIAEGVVLYEDENIKITLNADPYIDEYGTLTLAVIVENFTDMNIIASIDNCQINGWDCYGPTVSVTAGGKSKTEMDFYDVAEDAEVNDISELQEIKGVISYFDTDTYETIYESERQSWLFGE